MRAALVLLLVSCSKTSPSPAPTATVESRPTVAPERIETSGFAVVELFTSEGCSSCPPAEAVLHEIGESKGVIPLAFHVDYWNGSWVDRYSSANITHRQRGYAVSLGSGLYTPEMVVNGVTQFVGSKQDLAGESITAALSTHPRAALSISATRSSKSEWNVKWQSTPALPGTDLVLAVTERDLVVTPNAGELAGDTLHHDHVVRAFTTLDASSGSGTVTMTVPDVRIEKSRLVAFVQESDQRAIVAATFVEVR